jgi:DnaJ family protein C protein 11
MNDSHISGDWSTRLLGLKLKVGATASTAQLNAFLDAEGKVTQNVRTGLNVQLEYFGGIGMSIR